MDALTGAAASGLRARMESLDMLANNLANTETGGYKTDREFYSLYVSPDAAGVAPAQMPVIERQWTDFSQGVIRPTGNPLDFALSGKGFFSVDGPNGPLYTRQGSFKLSPAGVLVTTEGYAVRLANGRQLQTSSDGPLEVSASGDVIQQGQPLGKLAVMDFADTGVLSKQGSNYYRPGDPAITPAAATGVEIQQGKLEGSNVGTAESAVRLVGVMRQFEMLHKAMAIGAEMNKKAVEEVARVGS
jgi:flagellar basal-body rod protein FlgF